MKAKEFIKKLNYVDEFVLRRYDFQPFLKNESLFYFRPDEKPDF